MSAELLIGALRGGWLVLAFMMLFSRLHFQTIGAVRTRAFLVAWTTTPMRRAWGVACLSFATFLAAGALTVDDGMGAADWVLLSLLIAVLAADGLVNVLHAGFETFKDRVQASWVARQEGTGQEGDGHLFGAGNALLAAGAAVTAAVVLAYRPFEPWPVAGAVAMALALASVLVGSTWRRTR